MNPLKTFCILSATLLLPFSLLAAGAKPETSASVPVVSEPTPTPTPAPLLAKNLKALNPSKALIIHKPKPSPAWGKVIQYHRDQILALTEANRETIHEFVFQDEEGVVRTATFHENAAGEGFWEVWVWDQP